MNIPFPELYPLMIAPDWFNANRPCDEDAELTLLEQANEEWFNAIAKKYMRNAPFIKKPVIPPTNAEQADETGSDDDVFIVTTNEEVDESTSQDEESHDLDEITTTESADINNEDILSESPSQDSSADGAAANVETATWPYGDQSDNE